MNIVSFSGGKDSTAMLLMMIEKGIKVDRVICIDTTKEFPAMYRHIEKVQNYISPIEIEIVKIDFDYWFSEHIKIKGKLKGSKGYGWPDFRNRWCTSLKRERFILQVNNTAHTSQRRKGVKKIPSNVIEYHGIAFDEKERCKKDQIFVKYPLVEWEITEKQALEYCYNKGLNWENLYEKFQRVSCWCCPLSKIGELRVLYNEFPELWKKLEEMDKKSFRKFKDVWTIDQLTERFKNENKIPKLNFN